MSDANTIIREMESPAAMKAGVRRILARVAYDGTGYHGFAKLKDDDLTIEGQLGAAISSLLGRETEVIGASRTDAGVHALGNVAVFDVEGSIPTANLPDAINTRLPEDIRVRSAAEVPLDFHPRHTDTLKTYRYTIDNQHIADPLRARYAMLVGYDLDTERMQGAADTLVGEHDFKSFCSVHTQARTTIRMVTQIEIARDSARQESVYITVQGHGFLYNMVRIIAGTLIDVGRGRLAPDDVEGILYAKDRTANPSPTAEAKGLTLINISFPELGE